jgi:hypothetical protein
MGWHEVVSGVGLDCADDGAAATAPLQAAAKDYVSKDPAWPKRTEPCDKSS